MVKNSGQRIVFPILDADGDPVTGAASDTPDSEYSLDGASFSDCNDEIHEIATTSGIYYLDLLAAETNGDAVCIQVKTATAGTKTTVLAFYTSAQSLDTVDANIDLILQVEKGKWKIANNQLIFYASDDSTPLYTFDLKDADGNATSFNPYERTPV